MIKLDRIKNTLTALITPFNEKFEIDWDEFWQVVKGNGPCNAERMAARRSAHEDGQWVREAVNEYARKRAAGGLT